MPTRRAFLQQSAAALAAARLAAQPPRKPNLLFVFSDQQAWDMVGCYGNEQIRTPRLDRFAGEGVRFADCVSTCPVCTPYRGILLSGMHSLYNGAVVNDWQLLPGEGRHFGEVLRDGGYRTGYVGKWHLYGGNRNRPIPPGPHRHGFDHWFQSNNCHVNFHPGHCFWWNEAGEKVPFDVWEPYGQTRQACDFLDTCTADQPFALFVSWHPPHDHSGLGVYEGYDAPPELLASYDIDALRLRPNTPDTPQHRTMLHGHMAMCTMVDDCFGTLVDHLAARGLADDTIVVFTSDHGDLLRYEGGQRQVKTRPEEESAHVPLMLRWPGRLRPRVSNLLVGTINLMPTLLELCGLPIPKTCQGESLAGAMLREDDDAVEYQPVYMVPGHGWRGVYTRDWVYAHSAHEPTERLPTANLTQNRLHDRRRDPHGMNNLYGDEAQRAVQEHLAGLTRGWMAAIGDTNVPWPEVCRACGLTPNEANRPEATGILPGRPIDLLGAAGG